MNLRSTTFLCVAVCSAAGFVACAKDSPPAPPKEVEDAAATVAVPPEAPTAAHDAGRAVVRIGATSFHTSVSDQPAWPESDAGARRMGYLRHGAVVDAYGSPTSNDACKDGWYELVSGGFVCAKSVVSDLASPKVRLAPKQADRDAGMPYRYGVNVVDGTPLYRRVLGSEDRKKYEPSLAAKKEKEPAEEESSGGTEAKEESATTASTEAETPAAEETKPEPKSRRGAKDAGKNEKDAGKPKLKELRGRGVLVRKMQRGFYLALDRDFNAAGTRWWRTTSGLAVPFDRINVQQGVTKHHGTWFFDALLDGSDGGTEAPIVLALDAGANLADAGTSLAGLVGFVTHGSAHKIEVSADRKKAGWGAELPKRSAVLLTGETATVSGGFFAKTTSGFWVRPSDLKYAKPAIPADIAEGEKWIDVDLTRQALVAFEGNRPVFATLISSGRRDPTDKERDFPTVTGTFHVREKHVTTTMDGDVASDGPYSIEDVPWVMYFQGSYALHGAFWHDQFGNKRSHGCVNMSPEDARTIFGWAEPQLPAGWHGVFAKTDTSGSRIVVHEDPPPKRGAPPAP